MYKPRTTGKKKKNKAVKHKIKKPVEAELLAVESLDEEIFCEPLNEEADAFNEDIEAFDGEIIDEIPDGLAEDIAEIEEDILDGDIEAQEAPVEKEIAVEGMEEVEEIDEFAADCELAEGETLDEDIVEEEIIDEDIVDEEDIVIDQDQSAAPSIPAFFDTVYLNENGEPVLSFSEETVTVDESEETEEVEEIDAIEEIAEDAADEIEEVEEITQDEIDEEIIDDELINDEIAEEAIDQIEETEEVEEIEKTEETAEVDEIEEIAEDEADEIEEVEEIIQDEIDEEIIDDELINDETAEEAIDQIEEIEEVEEIDEIEEIVENEIEEDVEEIEEVEEFIPFDMGAIEESEEEEFSQSFIPIEEPYEEAAEEIAAEFNECIFVEDMVENTEDEAVDKVIEEDEIIDEEYSFGGESVSGDENCSSADDSSFGLYDSQPSFYEQINEEINKEDAEDYSAGEDMLRDTSSNIAKIKVIGVGGAGSNAVNRMIESGVTTSEFVAINTDKQALMLSLCDDKNRIQIGPNATKGLGAGADPVIGEAAAEESKAILEKHVEGVDLLFIAAGMGGGTGTGAAPVLAKIAKEKGCVTVAVVTRPFHFEGKKREANAKKGIANLAKYVDTIIIIPNDRLLEALPADTPVVDALKYADDTLRQGIFGIADLIATPSLINLDFADVRAVLKNQGLAHMGVGKEKGENRVVEAVRQAVSSPLLETTIEGASGVILNVTGGKDLTMAQVTEAADRVQEIIDPSANIIFGMNINPELQEEIIITLIATGFDKKSEDDGEVPAVAAKPFFAAGSPSLAKAQEAPKEEYMTIPSSSLNRGAAASSYAKTEEEVPYVSRSQSTTRETSYAGRFPTSQRQAPVEAPVTPVAPVYDEPTTYEAYDSKPSADDGKKGLPNFVKRLFGKKD